MSMKLTFMLMKLTLTLIKLTKITLKLTRTLTDDVTLGGMNENDEDVLTTNIINPLRALSEELHRQCR